MAFQVEFPGRDLTVGFDRAEELISGVPIGDSSGHQSSTPMEFLRENIPSRIGKSKGHFGPTVRAESAMNLADR